MSKRSGLPPHRPSQAPQSQWPAAEPALGDAIATTLKNMRVQLPRIKGSLNNVDERLFSIEGRLDGIDLSLKEVRTGVRGLMMWKERVFGVIIGVVVSAAMLAFAINILKMLEVKSP